MRKWSAEKKLHFMVKVHDPNTADYVDADRQWLVKSNPMAHCFEACCASDVRKFLEVHGDGKDNFSFDAVYKSQLTACSACSRRN